MIDHDMERFLAGARMLRLEELGRRLISGFDRSEDAILRLRWELEEELNNSLYVALDLLGWDLDLLRGDFEETRQCVDFLLAWFEAKEEYEACAQLSELRLWIESRCKFFLDEIASGVPPEELIGL